MMFMDAALLRVTVLTTLLVLLAGCGSPENDPVPAPSGTSETDVAPPPPAGRQPQVAIDETIHDFGLMQHGETATHIFQVRNSGTAPLTLKKGPASCKCVLGKLPPEGLPPGETAEIEVSWTPKEVQDDASESVIIETNDPEAPRLRLVVMGDAIPTLSVIPSPVWTLPDLIGDQPVELTTRIGALLRDKFSVISVESSDPRLTVEVEPLAEAALKARQFKSGYGFRLRFTPGEALKTFNAKITIQTDVPEWEKIEIPVEAVAAPAIQVFGPSWDAGVNVLKLGTFQHDEEKTATVFLFIRNPPEDFQFLTTKSDPAALELKLEPDPTFAGSGGRKRFKLQFRIPAGSPAAVRLEANPATVKVTTNHPDHPRLTFRAWYTSL